MIKICNCYLENGFYGPMALNLYDYICYSDWFYTVVTSCGIKKIR